MDGLAVLLKREKLGTIFYSCRVPHGYILTVIKCFEKRAYVFHLDTSRFEIVLCLDLSISGSLSKFKETMKKY